MATVTQTVYPQDPTNAGYDQPSDPPTYTQSVGQKGPVPQQYAPAPQQYAPAPQQYAPAPMQTYPVAQHQPQSMHHTNVNTVVVSSTPSPVVYTNSHLAWSILSCLCCFWPLGLVAIIFSVMSRDSAYAGDVEGARSKATVAMILNIISLVLGIICYVTFIAVYVSILNSVTTDDNYYGK